MFDLLIEKGPVQTVAIKLEGRNSPEYNICLNIKICTKVVNPFIKYFWQYTVCVNTFKNKYYEL